MRLTINQKYVLGLQMLGITNTELAKQLHCSKQYIGQLIKGQRKNASFNDWMNKNVMPLFETNKRFK